MMVVWIKKEDTIYIIFLLSRIIYFHVFPILPLAFKAM